MQETIEEILLRNSKRGMHKLKEYLKEDYCERAAKDIISLPRKNIIVTTGFYVAGTVETDGPPGAACLSYTLEKMGFFVILLTDPYGYPIFKKAFSGGNIKSDIKLICAGLERNEKFYIEILKKYRPVALIAIERCGRNIFGDYANMRGISIERYTAKIDLIFEIAKREGIMTIGIGDGGNEIGMGNLKDVISHHLSIVPCQTLVTHLIIATVSNWGAYGLSAYLKKWIGKPILPQISWIIEWIQDMVSFGCVDGVTKERECKVDGFPLEVEKEILKCLWRAAE